MRDPIDLLPSASPTGMFFEHCDRSDYDADVGDDNVVDDYRCANVDERAADDNSCMGGKADSSGYLIVCSVKQPPRQ